MTEEGQTLRASQRMCHPLMECVRTLQKQQGGSIHLVAQMRMRELSLETQSFVPPFLGRQMTSCLYSPYLTPERQGEIGQRPAGDKGPWQRQWKTVRGFPSSSCCDRPSYGRGQWEQNGQQCPPTFSLMSRRRLQ